MHKYRSHDGYRSLPGKRPFIAAGILALLHYLTLIAAITLGILVILGGSRRPTALFIGAVIVLGVTWLFGYFRRSSAKCPLCQGTPLLDSPAAKHEDAYHFPLLNYGTTAQLSLLLSHRFRCMYCGSGFDLLRKPSSRREPRDHSSQDEA